MMLMWEEEKIKEGRNKKHNLLSGDKTKIQRRSVCDMV